MYASQNGQVTVIGFADRGNAMNGKPQSQRAIFLSVYGQQYSAFQLHISLNLKHGCITNTGVNRARAGMAPVYTESNPPQLVPVILLTAGHRRADPIAQTELIFHKLYYKHKDIL